MKSFYKSKPIKNTKSIHDCHKSCKKDGADLVYFNTDNKGNYCECLNKVSKNREQIFNELRENGVGVNVHYIPIHTQPYYLQFGFKEGNFPNSEYYYSRTVSIPLFHTMTLEQQDEVVIVLNNILK